MDRGLHIHQAVRAGVRRRTRAGFGLGALGRALALPAALLLAFSPGPGAGGPADAWAEPRVEAGVEPGVEPAGEPGSKAGFEPEVKPGSKAGPAGTTGAGNLERYRREAERIRRRIEARKADAAALRRKESDCIQRLRETEKDLNDANRRMAALDRELSALNAAIGKKSAESQALAEAIAEAEAYAADRMVALYKLSRLGRMNLLASADSVNEFFRVRTALSEIVEHDGRLLAELAGRRAALSGVMAALSEALAEKRALEETCQVQRASLTERKAERERLLTEARDERKNAQSTLAALRRSAGELDEKIAALMRRAAAAAPAPDPDPPAGKSPGGGFTSFKGMLRMPVKGEIISRFGPYRNTELNVVNYQSGIDIKASMGAPIKAVRPGRVLFSNWFKGYGNLLIIDHGDSYYTLYAHAREVYKQEGDAVAEGEAIATVGDTDSLKGPILHFEIRHHGKPMDPMKWLKKG